MNYFPGVAFISPNQITITWKTYLFQNAFIFRISTFSLVLRLPPTVSVFGKFEQASTDWSESCYLHFHLYYMFTKSMKKKMIYQFCLDMLVIKNPEFWFANNIRAIKKQFQFVALRFEKDLEEIFHSRLFTSP